MRTRLAALTLGLYLCFSVLGCNSKPADSSSSNSNDSNAPAAPGGNNANGENSSSSAPANGAGSATSNSSGSAMSNMSNMKSQPKPEAPKPLVVPAGTMLTVRLSQAVGSKISTPGQTFTATLA